MRRSWILLALAACSLPSGDYFGRVPSHVDARHFTWCNQGEPDFLDPALASSTVSSPLVAALFVGPTAFGMDGEPVPSLATHWDVSPDLRTFTFHLRRDARWSNSRPLTAYDIAYTVLRIVDPLTASPNADTLGPMIGAMPYLARTVYVLRRAVGPYAAGQIVELVGGAAPDLATRTAHATLSLRDLGAPESAAYAHVPPGTPVELVLESGRRATWPSPGGVPWAYVYWPRDSDGVFGWVPAAELDGDPHGGDVLSVRAVASDQIPFAAASGDAAAPRPVVQVAARELERTSDVLGLRVPDPYTLEVQTTGPTPYFVAATDDRPFFATPIEAVSRSPRHWTDPDRIVDSGAFHLAAWKERDRVELVRSPTYWDASSVKLDRITALSVDDQAADTNIYFTGGCDAVAANMIPSSYLPALDGELRGRPYKDYVVAPLFSSYFVWINTKKLPNRHLRRALALAIDRAAVPRFTHGGEIPSAQLVPGTPIRMLTDAQRALCGVTRDTPGVALIMDGGARCYLPPPGLDYDLAAARAELALAKREMGAAFPAVLHYRYNVGQEAHKQIAEYLQAAWQKLGLHVELEAQEWNSMLADTLSGNYEIVRFGNQGSIVNPESEFLRPLLMCGASANRGRYCNPAYDKLMDEAAGIADPAARDAKLREAEAIAVGDAPLIPLFVYTQKDLIRPYVRDLATNLLEMPPLWRVWLDPDWRKARR